MCGIAGKLYFNPEHQVERGLILNMTRELAHRGPDDEGVWIKNNIGLGHRRLSIIDLSPSGHQPMSDAEGKIWITYNGEIYNFLELRRDLEKEEFRSKTDTEVIIYLYKKYGVDCLKYLRGMFAFAIWDDEKKQLFLARDRVGKKPLKFFHGPDFFIFASELKAILKDPKVPKEPDFEAIHHYLTFQYAPAPLTGFAGIKKLPPAHFMIVRQDGTYDIQRYWKLDYSEKLNLSEKEWRQKILDKLEESVKLRMISDVPLGAFLSGGIDSSAIVGLMSKISSKPVKTFTIGFKETSHNEIPYARRIAELFKTEHTEFVVKPDAVEILPKLARQYEEPYADSSAIPTWYLAELTRKYVTVALNGDGGDENFGGYTRYNAYKLFYKFHRLPKILRKKLMPELARLAAKIFFFGPRKEKALRFLKELSAAPERSYLELVSYFNQDQKEKLYADHFKNLVSKADSFKFLAAKFEEAKNFDWLDQALYADFNTYLPDDLMVKIDIATMARSLEGRSPLLDHEFLELTAKIPSSLKIRGRQKKYIFKKALKNFLPQETLYRTKMGFGVPLERWFKNELKDYLKSILLSEKALNRGIFKKSEIERLIGRHTAGKTNYAHHLWALLTLEHWFREYFD
ncbi:MAG: asparagine synthase (glutamine-hydrolyzing) [bacterium]|nr:asparagine synthase (glutamine-hydrolyzing) [bacterium]